MKLNLSLDGVEQMFRHQNLTGAAKADAKLGPGSKDGEESRAGAPKCPDIECLGADPQNIKNFVFLHGYNVNGQEARGWHSEMFKRMFWSGSKARFYGVTWYGWDTQVWLPVEGNTTLSYYVNVLNAFQTASEFNKFLRSNTMTGEKIVAAHSLGNMVASSAIADDNASVDKYFMFNAAVALEAFEEKEEVKADLIPSAWNGYLPRLRASEWYTLFEGQIPSDDRAKLTWRNRFANVKNVAAYNFYSEGDEIVSGPWQMGERWKGDVPVYSSYGGWKFNSMDYAHGPEYDIPPADANILTDETLRIKPFFDKGGLIAPLLLPNTPVINDAQRNELLARAFPATTWATGRSFSNALIDQQNINMQSNKGMTTKTIGANTITYWPRSNGQWRHSDIKNVAYPYLFKVYDNIICSGEIGTCKTN